MERNVGKGKEVIWREGRRGKEGGGKERLEGEVG